MKTTVYKDNLIVINDGRCFFYLYDADGEVNERSASDLQSAKDAIDAFEDEHGGLYDTNGELYHP